MSLDQNAINELKQICSKELGLELSDSEAWDMGIRLVNVFKAVADYCRKLEAGNRDNLTEEELNR